MHPLTLHGKHFSVYVLPWQLPYGTRSPHDKCWWRLDHTLCDKATDWNRTLTSQQPSDFLCTLNKYKQAHPFLILSLSASVLECHQCAQNLARKETWMFDSSFKIKFMMLDSSFKFISLTSICLLPPGLVQI